MHGMSRSSAKSVRALYTLPRVLSGQISRRPQRTAFLFESGVGAGIEEEGTRDVVMSHDHKILVEPIPESQMLTGRLFDAPPARQNARSSRSDFIRYFFEVVVPSRILLDRPPRKARSLFSTTRATRMFSIVERTNLGSTVSSKPLMSGERWPLSNREVRVNPAGTGGLRPPPAIATRLLTVAVLTLGLAQSSRADWELWMSPVEEAEFLDQYQADSDPLNSAVAYGDITVGQTFVPSNRSLFRMDFRLSNADDARPGRIKLYYWRGSRKATVQRTPLFEDVVDLSGFDGYRTHSYFPRRQVEPGETYYVEFTGEDRPAYRVAQSAARDDPYSAGRAWKSGPPAPPGLHRDLWFRTFALPQTSATGRSVSRPRVPPERLESSLPLRIASSSTALWFEPENESETVTRRDYMERVKTFADRFRATLFESCRENLYGNALREAFLYRVSCEEGRCNERHARDALGYFERGHAWQFCVPRPDGKARSCKPACSQGANVTFNSIDRPAKAYLWLRSSPTFTARDHIQIRDLLLDRARRLWPNREAGSHNRAMVAAVAYRMVADLFPDIPEAKQWRAYADSVWSAFWDVRDTDEDSAHYSAVVWWPAVLDYVEAARLENEVWSDPAFLRLVDRFARETIPVGVLPNWGDGAGWAPDPSGLIRLFEAAANRTRRSDYRWLAHRLFAYSAGRIRDDWPNGDAYYKRHVDLIHAYLAADESLEPKAPAERREELSANRPTTKMHEHVVESGKAIGAVVRIQASPLVRLELRARTIGDEGPARISLWRWHGTREASINRPPLYQDTFAVPKNGSLQAISAHPFLEVEIGADYYFEVERPSASMIVGTEDRSSTKLALAVFTLKGESSIVTDRVRATRLRKDDVRSPRQHFEFTEERIPDKLVLRSGNDPDDLHATFNLVAEHHHGQSETGALVSLVDGGSVLMTSGPFPYWFFGNVRTPQDESLPFFRRHWGGLYGEPGNGASVEGFADARCVTFASLRFLDPYGWQVRQERRIFFVKNRFLLIRDRFTVPARMSLSAGPLWRARDLASERGGNYFDLYDRQPLHDNYRMRNPERHAMVYFVSRSGLSSDAIEVKAHLPPARCDRGASARIPAECRGGPTFVAFQRWAGEAKPGESLFFDTLILPHGSKRGSHELASGIRELSATDGVALEIEMGSERWLVVDNPSGRVIESPDFTTDAQYLVARSDPNKPFYLLTHEASRVRWRNVAKTWSVPTSVELGGEPTPGRLQGW